MVRRSFRIGLRLGLLIGVTFALVKTVQSRRAASQTTAPPPEPWQPIVDTADRARPAPVPTRAPAPTPAPPATRAPAPAPVRQTTPAAAPTPVDSELAMPDVPEPAKPVPAAKPQPAPVPAAAAAPAAPPARPTDEVGEPILEVPAPDPAASAEGEFAATIDDGVLDVPLVEAGLDVPDEPVAPVKKAAAKPRAAAKKATKKAAAAAPAATEVEPAEPAEKALKAPKAAKATKKAAKAAKAAATSPSAWVLPNEGACPSSHPVKVKIVSMLMHLPGMLAYDRTRPDRCYTDEAAAQVDGFTRARR